MNNQTTPNIKEIVTRAVMESLDFHQEFTVLTEDQTDYMVSQEDFADIASMAATKVIDRLLIAKHIKNVREDKV